MEGSWAWGTWSSSRLHALARLRLGGCLNFLPRCRDTVQAVVGQRTAFERGALAAHLPRAASARLTALPRFEGHHRAQTCQALWVKQSLFQLGASCRAAHETGA